VNRRTLLRGLSAAIAVGAIGGGVAFQRWRSTQGRQSDRITGDWTELGPGAQWILPDLRAAQMIVPDRPHDVAEARDPSRRNGVKRVRGFTVTSSSRRLRGDTWGSSPANGAVRLVGIGDSVTFGWGVADNESWPAQVEAELTRRGRKVEVLNAGVPAQRLPTMVAWLEKIAPTLGIHGVLFTRRPYPEGNDPIQAYADAIQRVRRALPQARIQVLMPPVSRFDPHGSRVWQQESQALAGRLGGQVPVLDLTPAMRAAQGERGAKLDMSGNTFRMLSERGEVLEEAPAQEFGLPESFYARFESDPTVREALFFDDGHPDAEGFGHLAKVIADTVEQAGWFA
jgi:lysophospholipase L1-like esterase